MKHILIFIGVLFLCWAQANAAITIRETIELKNGGQLVVNGNWENYGDFIANGHRVTFSGTGVDTIINSNGEIFDELEIDKTAGDVILGYGIQINELLHFVSGNLITDTCLVTLADSANILGEASGHYLIGQLVTTQQVGALASDLGGIGVMLGEGNDIGDVNVLRVSGPAGVVTSGDSMGINRFWLIASTLSPETERTLTLSWVSDDDNGKDPSLVRIWRSTNDGGSWHTVSGVQDVSEDDPRQISTSLVAFGGFTVSDIDNPLMIWYDFNGDQQVDIYDVQWIVRQFDSTMGQFDLNGDQLVNEDDLKLVMEQWRQLSE